MSEYVRMCGHSGRSEEFSGWSSEGGLQRRVSFELSLEV